MKKRMFVLLTLVVLMVSAFAVTASATYLSPMEESIYTNHIIWNEMPEIPIERQECNYVIHSNGVIDMVIDYESQTDEIELGSFELFTTQDVYFGVTVEYTDFPIADSQMRDWKIVVYIENLDGTKSEIRLIGDDNYECSSSVVKAGAHCSIWLYYANAGNGLDTSITMNLNAFSSTLVAYSIPYTPPIFWIEKYAGYYDEEDLGFAWNDGYEEGFNDGEPSGYNEGFDEGKAAGLADVAEQVNAAYRNGVTKGESNDVSESFLDIIGEIAFAPYRAVSTMFDFEVFGFNLAGVVVQVFTFVVAAFVIGICGKFFFG